MFSLKTREEILVMKEGGKRLAKVKQELVQCVVPGVKPSELEDKANKLIADLGGRPSFKMVKGYKWATCINVNDGVVHGVPNGPAFAHGDVVSVDVGFFYRGFHTDSAFTLALGEVAGDVSHFLDVGKEALERSIRQAKPGSFVSDISKAIQKVVEGQGYSVSRDLTGHGVGRKLHEPPQIPCFWEKGMDDVELLPGATLAVEVIYAMGSPELVLSSGDNWTISTKDGRISALFEETVAVTSGGPQILTTG